MDTTALRQLSPSRPVPVNPRIQAVWNLAGQLEDYQFAASSSLCFVIAVGHYVGKWFF